MTLALEGIKVLDFSQVESGPLCTQVLADYGAEVLKVERVGVGDSYRNFQLRLNGASAHFLALNRNKKSLAIDVQKPEGREIIRQLAREYDVVVENFRPGVMDRLGLGYDDLSAINPGIIFASISGFGQTGPYRDRKGQDIMAQALSGLTWMNGSRDDPPTLCGIPMADFACGAVLCQGILIALLARYRTGKGQRVETSLLNAMLFPQLQDLLVYMNTEKLPVRAPRGGSRPFNGPTSGVYQAKDGYVVVTIAFAQGNNVSEMCRILGIEDLGIDPRFDTKQKTIDNFEELYELFAVEFRKKTVAEWVEIFEKADSLCAPAYNYEEVCRDPQVVHNEMIAEIDHPKGGKVKALGSPMKLYGTPWEIRSGPPELGAHTEETLLGLGYTPEQITALRAQKVVG